MVTNIFERSDVTMCITMNTVGNFELICKLNDELREHGNKPICNGVRVFLCDDAADICNQGIPHSWFTEIITDSNKY